MSKPTVSDESESRPDPVMRVTTYDRASMALIVTVLGLFFAASILAMVYFMNKEYKTDLEVPLEMLVIGGGEEDGAPDETLFVDSPLDEVTDPSPSEEESEEVSVEEMLETVVEESTRAIEQMPTQLNSQDTTSGKPGSATGTGRKPLGSGGGPAGVSNEGRWDIQWGSSSLAEYAKQLDFFKIELGAIVPSEGKMYRRSKFSKGKPVGDEITSGKDEKRLYFARGRSHPGDVALLKKGGVPTKRARIFRIYPRATELLLYAAEVAYAKRNRKTIPQVRRTIFIIQKVGSGYQFKVKNQYYF